MGAEDGRGDRRMGNVDIGENNEAGMLLSASFHDGAPPEGYPWQTGRLIEEERACRGGRERRVAPGHS